MKKIDWFGNTSKKGPLFKPVKLPTKKSVRKIPKKNLTWPQAQVKYPKLKPFADADKDGKLNMFDCKPFNKKKHGWSKGHSLKKKSGSIRMMTPDKFLRTTYYEQLQRDGNTKRPKMSKTVIEDMRYYTIDYNKTPELKKAIKSKRENVVLPKIVYGNKGKQEVYNMPLSVHGDSGLYYYDTSKQNMKKGEMSLPREGVDTGHDGRHRALAAKELGIKLIPVAVYGRETNIKGMPEMTIKEQKQYGKEHPEVLKHQPQKKDFTEMSDATDEDSISEYEEATEAGSYDEEEKDE